MSEAYEITEDETGTDIVVVRVICQKCSHYILRSPVDAAKIDDSFQCELCSTPENITKSVKTWERCGTCSQVYDPKSPECFCPNKTKPAFTYSHKSNELKDPTRKRLEDQIQEGKLQTLEKKIVRNVKLEAVEREKRMDTNLSKLVKIAEEKNV